MRQGIYGAIAAETFAMFIRKKTIFNDVATGIGGRRRTLGNRQLSGGEPFYLRADPLRALCHKGVRLTGCEKGDAGDGDQEHEPAKYEWIF